MYIPSNKPLAKLKDLEFLERIAATLRQATKDIEREEMPEGIRAILSKIKSSERDEHDAPKESAD